jgi:serine/threonine protein kinase
LVSHDGRALIASLDHSQSFESFSIRYSAPEILDEDDAHPKTASDMWSLGCVIYEVSYVPSLILQAHLVADTFWKGPVLPDTPRGQSWDSYWNREKTDSSNSTRERRGGNQGHNMVPSINLLGIRGQRSPELYAIPEGLLKHGCSRRPPDTETANSTRGL